MSRIAILLAKCILLILLGLLLIILSSGIQVVDPPQIGEYYYSGFLRNNYTVLTACIFLITGVLIGFFLKWNPWQAGISLILIFPIAAIYEAIVYQGSHNLIPFELAIYLIWSLPSVAGVYFGRFISHRIADSK